MLRIWSQKSESVSAAVIWRACGALRRFWNQWRSVFMRCTLWLSISVSHGSSQGCSDAAELGHSCDVSGDPVLRRQAESLCHQLLENPFTHCHLRVRHLWYESPSHGILNVFYVYFLLDGRPFGEYALMSFLCKPSLWRAVNLHVPPSK